MLRRRDKRKTADGGEGEGSVAEVAAAFWDDKLEADPTLYWTAHPVIRPYVNESVSGAAWISPLSALKVTWGQRRLARGLSLGCGTGGLERNVYQLAICDRMDAYDIARESVRAARRAARAEGVKGVRYRVADCDRIELPKERYDIAFFHHSLHHIADPDRLLAQVERSLKPHGLLYVDEYLGPSRDEWLDRDLRERWLEPAGEIWDSVPEELRWRDRVHPPLDLTDPSEMIRSSRILPAIRERFEMIHERPYWGNLLNPLICSLQGLRLLEPRHHPLVASWVARERDLVTEGRISEPMFAVLLARKVPELAPGLRATVETYKLSGRGVDGEHQEGILQVAKVRATADRDREDLGHVLAGLGVRELEPASFLFDAGGLLVDHWWRIGRGRCSANALRDSVLRPFATLVDGDLASADLEPNDVAVFVGGGDATRLARVLRRSDRSLGLEVKPVGGPVLAVELPVDGWRRLGIIEHWGTPAFYRFDPSLVDIGRLHL